MDVLLFPLKLDSLQQSVLMITVGILPSDRFKILGICFGLFLAPSAIETHKPLSRPAILVEITKCPIRVNQEFPSNRRSKKLTVYHNNF